MFTDSLFASAPSVDSHSHRGRATLISFALQVFAAGALLWAPLLRIQGLPQLHWMAPLVAPAAPPAPSAVALRNAHRVMSNMSSEGRIIAPRAVPREIVPIVESVAPPPVDAGTLVVAGGTGDSVRNGVLNTIGA